MKQSLKISIEKRMQKISSGNFSCDDIKLLYVDVRDFSLKDSITREIGDYIAHPKEKDRGISHKRASEQYAAFKRMGDILSGRCPGESDTIVVKPTFENEDLVNDLVLQLESHKFDRSNDLYLQSKSIGLCIISILQDAIIKIDKSTSVETNVLFVDGIISLGVTYFIDWKGRMQAVSATLIQGSYKNDEIGKGTKSLISGNTFSIAVNNSIPTIVFSN